MIVDRQTHTERQTHTHAHHNAWGGAITDEMWSNGTQKYSTYEQSAFIPAGCYAQAS